MSNNIPLSCSNCGRSFEDRQTCSVCRIRLTDSKLEWRDTHILIIGSCGKQTSSVSDEIGKLFQARDIIFVMLLEDENSISGPAYTRFEWEKQSQADFTRNEKGIWLWRGLILSDIQILETSPHP